MIYRNRQEYLKDKWVSKTTLQSRLMAGKFLFVKGWDSQKYMVDKKAMMTELAKNYVNQLEYE